MNGTNDGGFPGSGPAAPRRRARARRGVLLLVVLSMLTLFMMLGVAYLAVATRSRETAKAYARLSLRSDNVRLPHSQIFDTVMLRVLRGVPSDEDSPVTLAQPAPPSGVTVARFESLLADKYGGDFLDDEEGRYTGTLAGTAEGNPPVYEKAPVLVLPKVTLDRVPDNDEDGNPFAATDLAGRVITILGSGREPSSHRILRANGSGVGPYEIFVDRQPSQRAFEPVLDSSCRVIINGRDFSGDDPSTKTNEAWDGFDDANPFLTWLAPRDRQNEGNESSTSLSSSVVKKVGFVNLDAPEDLDLLLNKTFNGISCGADNDNDGVKDGFFLDFGLPSVVAANGDQVILHASVLVVDLDGRANVNAHGSLVPLVYPQVYDPDRNIAYPQFSAASVDDGWNLADLPTGFPTGNAYAGIPTGSGYGPPEVNLDLLFPPGSTEEWATYNFGRRMPDEFPLMYLRTGVNATSEGKYPFGSRFYSESATGTATPRIGAVEGRYGAGIDDDVARPGEPSVNDAVSAITDYRSPVNAAGAPDRFEGVPPLWWDVDSGAVFNWTQYRAIYNSPPDLHGRMKTFTVARDQAGSGIAPQLVFVKPEWSSSAAGSLDAETRDDPYEIRLGAGGPRNGWLRSGANAAPYGNVFNLSELESVLRPYDVDCAKLSPRLKAMLGSVSEEARLRITTDSWDTTLISGSAAPRFLDWSRELTAKLADKLREEGRDPNDIYGLIYGNSKDKNAPVLDGVLNREVARGERFDLNRPLTGEKPPKYDIRDRYYAQRQAYFKDLYVLVYALTPPEVFEPTNTKPDADGLVPADRLAQWVANVVEFRDADSTMTPFEYDRNPADGWDVDGNVQTVDDPAGEANRGVVFGCERPELVIAETSAWEDETTGELYVVLHRPWNARAFGADKDGNTASVAGEPCDPSLDSSAEAVPQNKLNLGRKAGNDLPVWRLRIKVDGEAPKIVRLDTDNQAAGALAQDVLATDEVVEPLGVDSSVCLKPSQPSPVVTVDGPTGSFRHASFQTLRVQGQPQGPGVNRQATVYLERLSDPGASPLQNKPDWTDPGDTPPSELTDSEGQLTRMAVYRVVDQQSFTVVNRSIDPLTGLVPPAAIPESTRRVMDGPGALWKQTTDKNVSPGNTIRIDATWPTAVGNAPNGMPKWFFWPNRPFVASPELLFVHGLSSQQLLEKYTDPPARFTPDPDTTAWTWGPTVLRNLESPPIFDAVHVPTRFAGIHGTTDDPDGSLAIHAGIDQVTTPVNQLSGFREPGRVNLNTVTAIDVWNAVVAGPVVDPDDGSPAPVVSQSNAGLGEEPARNASSLLALTGREIAGTTQQYMPVADDDTGYLGDAIRLNPSQAIYSANRLANTVTNRSHLFGVWITLREAVAPPTLVPGEPAVPSDPDAVRYHRAFYIIDRSIPVAHEPGRDHNVWDSVLLRRIIE